MVTELLKCMCRIIKVGNVVGNGKSQGGCVFNVDGISPTLLNGMSHGNVMPFIVEVKKNEGRYDNEECRVHKTFWFTRYDY